MPVQRVTAKTAGTYVVVADDYLIGIAARAGVSVADLSAANKITSPDAIYVGQKLVIPAGGHVPVTAAAAAAAVAVSVHDQRIDTVVSVAKAQIGKPYVYGYAGPDAFDCSGLVRYSFARAGINLLHNTLLQKAQYTAIDTTDLHVGDVVFFHANYSHEAIYLGNNLIIQAPAPHSNIQINWVPLGWITAAIRPIP